MEIKKFHLLFIFLVVIISCSKKGIDQNDVNSVWADIQQLKNELNISEQSNTFKIYYPDSLLLKNKNNPIHDSTMIKRELMSIDRATSDMYHKQVSYFSFYLIDTLAANNNFHFLLLMGKSDFPYEIPDTYSQLDLIVNQDTTYASSLLLMKHERYSMSNEIVSSVVFPNKIIIRRQIIDAYSDAEKGYILYNESYYTQQIITEFFKFNAKKGSFNLLKKNVLNRNYTRKYWFFQ